MKYITEKKLIESIYKLDNAQDRLILAGSFYGLLGTKGGAEALRNLKVSDVDGKIVTIDGIKITMNNYLSDIMAATIAETIYERVDDERKNSFYYLNMSSEYVIKSRPLPVTNDGLKPISYDGFRSRIRSLSSYLGLDVSTTTLKASGAYHILKKYYEENKILPTIAASSELLRSHGFNVRLNTIHEMIKDIKNNGYEQLF